MLRGWGHLGGHASRFFLKSATPAPGDPDLVPKDARALCARLATQRWGASLSAELGRWKLELGMEPRIVVDYTAPISEQALQNHLFMMRLPDDEAVLSPDRAVAIAAEFARGDCRM